MESAGRVWTADESGASASEAARVNRAVAIGRWIMRDANRWRSAITIVPVIASEAYELRRDAITGAWTIRLN